VEAYRAIVDKYYARSLRYAVRMLGNREDAEEVVQDTFVRAFRGLNRYDPRGRFEAWLFRILINRCRTKASRELRRRRTILPAEELSPAAAPQTDPGDPLLRRDIRRALLVLKPEYREAFLLKHVEELSYAEMEMVTGDRTPALKMRVKRARDQLQNHLAGGRDVGTG